MRTLLHVALAAVLLGLAACGEDGDDDGASGAGDNSRTTDAPADPGHIFFGSVVEYDTELAGAITAEYLEPEGAAGVPGIVLLHQFGGSRQQWAEFAPVLAQSGYAVLAPDLDYEGSDTDTLLSAVRGGADYLKAQSAVDPERIAVVGASYGANLAYVSSGLYDDLATSISMSPSSRPDDPSLIGRGYEGFAPRSVLFVSDEAESPDATVLANTVDDPVTVKIYIGQAAHGGRAAHGVELLENELAVSEILEWLAERFA